ncbi:hypothetical protein [Aequorivita viscosa]|uniref:Uncharacterized protein n=1 Tax=Aequorivita viscosa TaxID=797419 RepID=A0A1M6MKQ2_9FLAO|nr:hypothetical protein [Aequorivita viscosa]SDX51071.1 hypothetical protein SAMN05216556_13819 [Aequorivita viscosa]SHJ83994.1 hypothetical protein SAMN04487908_1283 [Aequorivita viscosa]
MKKRQIFILIGLLVIIGLVTNLPFLPGPNNLFRISQAIYDGSSMLALFGLVLIPIGLIWTIILYKKKETKNRFASIILWALPLTLFVSTSYLSMLTRNFSRSIAIERAQTLIQELEDFKSVYGFYPDSLTVAGLETPSTGIIGIEDFYYTKNDSSYELTFYHNVILSFNYEIVTYDNTDRHTAKGEIKELHETGYDHWKYEIFD